MYLDVLKLYQERIKCMHVIKMQGKMIGNINIVNKLLESVANFKYLGMTDDNRSTFLTLTGN
jgi:hypothetical protein